MKVWINSEEESNMVSGKNCLRQMAKDLQKNIMFNFLFNCLLCCETISGGLDSKEAAHSAGEQVSISGLGRSPGEGNGNPLQYSCLENSMDRGAWQSTVHGVAKSWK